MPSFFANQFKNIGPINPLVQYDTFAPFFLWVKRLTTLNGKLSLPGFSALLDSLNHASCVAKWDGELVEPILVHVPHQEVSFTEGTLCGNLGLLCYLWWPGQTPCDIRVQQQPLHYVRWVTNLKKEPKLPVLTLVQQVSEVEHYLLHLWELCFLHWMHTGMNVLPLHGMNHIRLLNQKQPHQLCGNVFFLLAFWTQSATKPSVQPQNR